MIKSKALKFTCCRCSKPVYKLGKRVREDRKLCGSCNGKSRQFGKRGSQALRNTISLSPSLPQDPLKSVKHTIEVSLQAEGKLTVSDSINHYRLLLNKVETLFTDNPELSFYELWRLAKQ